MAELPLRVIDFPVHRPRFAAGAADTILVSAH
jgi:hypothetical protein